jgi:beta-1,4-mannooligosaccharide phosphorylase
VLIRPFIPADRSRLTQIIGRALALSEEETGSELEKVRREFSARHRDLDSVLLGIYRRVEVHVFTHRPLSRARRLLIGALFSGEYALESAALFNPSIVPHPDQSGLEPGALRFIMSLRATGEGHISSIEFRTGVLSPSGEISAENVTRFFSPPEIVTNPTYEKASFLVKLHEMGFETDFADSVLAPLGETFTLEELDRTMRHLRHRLAVNPREEQRTLECVRWLAESNYELRFSANLAVSERVIFPVSPNETNGIENARFVRLVDDDGAALYYATYTAYNGRVILPQLMKTRDFLDFRVLTLNGRAVQNKGMALFPRRIDGLYAMISRQDDQNLFIMFSDNPHFWDDPQILVRPSENWELFKIGLCCNFVVEPSNRRSW